MPISDKEAIAAINGGIGAVPSGPFLNSGRCASLDIVSALRLTQKFLSPVLRSKLKYGESRAACSLL